jgi:hypothetical protein
MLFYLLLAVLVGLGWLLWGVGIIASSHGALTGG